MNIYFCKKKLLSSKSWEIQRSRCFILQLHKSEKDGKTKHKRKIIGFQYVPVACLESYRSHRGYCGSCKIWKIATKLFAILFYQFQDNYCDFFFGFISCIEDSGSQKAAHTCTRLREGISSPLTKLGNISWTYANWVITESIIWSINHELATWINLFIKFINLGLIDVHVMTLRVSISWFFKLVFYV